MKPKTRTQFTKRLADLTPPVHRRATPYERFTADLHVLNHFLWSTELALATVLSDYCSHEDSGEPATRLLARTGAQALVPRGRSKTPHYTGKMGSFLVQLRWNYDALARYAIIDGVSVCERFLRERLSPILGAPCPSSFAAVYECLRDRGLSLDPRAALVAQVYKAIRNDIVHERSTIHSFPSAATIRSVGRVCQRALAWQDHQRWPRYVNAARHEVFVTTQEAAEAYDVPQLFFAAIFALTRIAEFGDAVEAVASECLDGARSS